MRKLSQYKMLQHIRPDSAETESLLTNSSVMFVLTRLSLVSADSGLAAVSLLADGLNKTESTHSWST